MFTELIFAFRIFKVMVTVAATWFDVTRNIATGTTCEVNIIIWLFYFENLRISMMLM